MLPIALTVAGSDPSGGAGIQADLKTFHQFGVYGEAVITLITVQNTREVSRVEVLPPELIVDQLKAVLSDLPPQAAKFGALGSAEVVDALANMAASFPFPLVLDPVLVSKHGARLGSKEAEELMRSKLFPHCTLVTPNISEAEAFTGLSIESDVDMGEAAMRIADMGPKAVLIKGGHREGTPDDLLFSQGTTARILPGVRVNTTNTHGTGCTYSSAITACLARGIGIDEAVERAKQFIQQAIASAPGIGHGFGPINHFAPISFAAAR